MRQAMGPSRDPPCEGDVILVHRENIHVIDTPQISHTSLLRKRVVSDGTFPNVVDVLFVSLEFQIGDMPFILFWELSGNATIWYIPRSFQVIIFHAHPFSVHLSPRTTRCSGISSTCNWPCRNLVVPRTFDLDFSVKVNTVRFTQHEAQRLSILQDNTILFSMGQFCKFESVLETMFAGIRCY